MEDCVVSLGKDSDGAPFDAVKSLCALDERTVPASVKLGFALA